MTLVHRVASILRWLFHRNEIEQEMHDELQAFVDMAITCTTEHRLSTRDV